jgi:hypothetical protein
MEVFGCWQEARRCDLIAVQLIRVRNDLRLEFYDPITVLLGRVDQISRLLRDLHDFVLLYRERVPLVQYYLAVILPCLQKTLRDMDIYIGNDMLPSGRQWILMNERLDDQGGMKLATRFQM